MPTFAAMLFCYLDHIKNAKCILMMTKHWAISARNGNGTTFESSSCPNPMKACAAKNSWARETTTDLSEMKCKYTAAMEQIYAQTTRTPIFVSEIVDVTETFSGIVPYINFAPNVASIK